MWGDQWICKCGWHNLFLRQRCRNCGATQAEGWVEDESAMEILAKGVGECQ
jgi:hypothetical protein